MLDSEITDPSISPQHKYAELLSEFGKLVGDMNVRVEEINLLKHEIRNVEERKRLEVFPDDETLKKYDDTISALKEAQSCIKRELSIYELRAAELRPVFYGIKPRYTK